MTEQITFASINDFPLKWRFAEDKAKWTVLPPNDLAFFKPLTEDSAQKLWSMYVTDTAQHLMEIVLKSDPPNQNQFGNRLLAIDDNWSTDEEHKRVADVFRHHIDVPRLSRLYFFWNASCAVETTWDLLLRYWSDFCYPSDDSNVAVLLDASINLYYIEGTIWLDQTPDHETLK